MNVPELLSPTQARASGSRFYFTGKECNHGHVAQRWLSNGSCRDCNRISSYNRGIDPESKAAAKARYNAQPTDVKVNKFMARLRARGIA